MPSVSEPGGMALYSCAASKKTLLYLIENIPFSPLIVYNKENGNKTRQTGFIIVTFCNDQISKGDVLWDLFRLH